MTRSRLFALLALLWSILLVGCAGLPAQVDRPVSKALAAPADSPLGSVARQAGIPDGRSGFWPVVQGSFALDGRLELIRRATVSLDLQYYLIANDGTGRLILRALRDAAQRGVRVRLLVDDLYTEDLDDLLLGLAAEPNVEIRLFNPFGFGRSSGTLRLVGLLTDFRRLNHRMHNKLFVADGSVAIAGGRNLADEYFYRSKLANFIDFDLLITGSVVSQLEGLFDEYWNSDQVYPVNAVTQNGLEPAQQRASFDRLTSPASTPLPEPVAALDLMGGPALAQQFESGQFRFVVGDATAFADRPDKRNAGQLAAQDSATRRAVSYMREAKEGGEVIIISPYFIPGKVGMANLKEAREHKVRFFIITNSFAASDEPLVSVGYDRYRGDMLRMGIQLFEISSTRLKRDAHINKVLGVSSGRLHAKLAIVDRELFIVGSTNMDPRSVALNTEIAVAVRGREITRLVAKAFYVDESPGVYEVRLQPDGKTLQWIGRNDDGEDRLDDEPDAAWLQRLRLFFLSLFVPEDLL